MTLRTAIVGAFISISLSNCSYGQHQKEMQSHTNDLINETSPYLLQHAHNPVDWHAWNEQNLAEAKNLGKPLLISVGYSACHWCHVMEHESFEDEEVAAFMNEHFYCIKVDREERPDVDQVYMTAANIITGRGGWPLNCFALPDGRPFHAGTYYPKAGWMKLLQTVHNQYNSNYGKLESYAEKLTQGIQMQETAISDNPREELSYEVVENTVSTWSSSFDMHEGGRQGAPKFPMPSNYEFLMAYNYHAKEEKVDEFVQLSLNKMAKGGIYDQIKGGFARYSTDAYWKLPHFEKMLYDNGQLLSVYSKAYLTYNQPLYLEIVEQTIDWLEDEMRHESGLFFSALDADSEGEEGKFYVWSNIELKEILGELYPLAAQFYNVNAKGLWENGNYILLRGEDENKIRAEFNLTESELADKVKSINQKLLEARKERVRPGLDDKCLTSWNGLLLTGLTDAYIASSNNQHLELAIKLANALLKHQLKQGQVYHSFKDGKSTIDGLLEDYVFSAQGLLRLYQVTSESKYLAKANELVEDAITHFYDGEKGMFYMNKENELIVRTSEIYDNVIPSGNAAMALILQQLGLLQTRMDYVQMSKDLIAKIQSNMVSYPSGHSYWSLSHLGHSKPYYELVIIGSGAKEEAQKVFGMNLFNVLVVYSEKASNEGIFKDRYKKDKTLFYLCRNGACLQPEEQLSMALKPLSTP
ncbi:MAG: thioredoxin domain-containing protein [Bacteroidia bacterium]